MTRSEILKKISEICREVFDDDELIVSDETTAKDVEEWDSLSHLILISETEKTFSIKFTMGEIQNFANVGEFVDAINNKLL